MESNDPDDDKIKVEIIDLVNTKLIKNNPTHTFMSVWKGQPEKRLLCMGSICSQMIRATSSSTCSQVVRATPSSTCSQVVRATSSSNKPQSNYRGTYTKCKYGNNCIYAHSIEEQNIDIERKFHLKIILDTVNINFNEISKSKLYQIYKKILVLCQMCRQCERGKCTGGFNCRYGACCQDIKVCKTDYLTGSCLNKVDDLKINSIYCQKILDKELVNVKGCINGSHLSHSINFIPYYKFLFKKDNIDKDHIEIDVNFLNKIINNIEESDESDEELNEIFKKKTNLQDL